MTIQEIKEKIKSPEYDFLRYNEHLGNNIILLGLGGSYAYGTNNENSDLDIRGCATNTMEEILTNQNFEQFVNEETDTTIYSFNKLISLLTNVNPNTIEMLGLKPEHYLFTSRLGRILLNNSHIFLSKRVVHSFGGYAIAQLHRLDNKANRTVGQAQNEEHILKTIENAAYDFKGKFFSMPKDAIKLYTDKAVEEGYDTEIFMDINLHHYPLRDYNGMIAECQSIVKSYSKIGKRNEHAIEHNKLGKHMMHLIRLYLMCLDILEKEQIITYRDKDHDMLMDIRNGKYLDSNNQPIPEFYEMVNDFEKKLDYAKENTSLPDSPNYEAINDLMKEVNYNIVGNKWHSNYFYIGDD